MLQYWAYQSWWAPHKCKQWRVRVLSVGREKSKDLKDQKCSKREREFSGTTVKLSKELIFGYECGSWFGSLKASKQRVDQQSQPAPFNKHIRFVFVSTVCCKSYVTEQFWNRKSLESYVQSTNWCNFDREIDGWRSMQLWDQHLCFATFEGAPHEC